MVISVGKGNTFRLIANNPNENIKRVYNIKKK